jgi:hypothetical protein
MFPHPNVNDTAYIHQTDKQQTNCEIGITDRSRLATIVKQKRKGQYLFGSIPTSKGRSYWTLIKGFEKGKQFNKVEPVAFVWNSGTKTRGYRAPTVSRLKAIVGVIINLNAKLYESVHNQLSKPQSETFWGDIVSGQEAWSIKHKWVRSFRTIIISHYIIIRRKSEEFEKRYLCGKNRHWNSVRCTFIWYVGSQEQNKWRNRDSY